MVKAQCLRDLAIKMNSSIDSTNMLVAYFKPLYWALWPRLYETTIKIVNVIASSHGQLFWPF